MMNRIKQLPIYLAFLFSINVGMGFSQIQTDSIVVSDSTYTAVDSVLLIQNDSIVEVLDSITIPEKVSIIGVGDIMLGTNFPSTNYLPPANGARLLKGVDSILRSADLTFGNLEGCLLNEGGKVKKCSDPKKCYAFRMPENYVHHLVDAGFDVVSIANNHLGDFGNEGRINTQKILDSVQLNYAGLIGCPFTSFEKNGIKYGFCAFAPNTGTVDIRKIDEAEQIVKRLKDSCDIVIVSFHGGAEGKSYRHVTRKTEYFYNEDRGNVYEFSHRLIDAGADIIFGHGPHITRGIELYKNRIIAYSLGNFCTYARFNLSGHNGVAPLLKLNLTREGVFVDGRIIPIKQLGEGGPILDPLNTAIKEVIELNATDFPESPLEIDSNGFLRSNTSDVGK